MDENVWLVKMYSILDTAQDFGDSLTFTSRFRVNLVTKTKKILSFLFWTIATYPDYISYCTFGGRKKNRQTCNPFSGFFNKKNSLTITNQKCPPHHKAPSQFSIQIHQTVHHNHFSISADEMTF